MPYWLSLVADLHVRTGNEPAAAAVLDAARVFAVQHDDHWWLPEVLRARSLLDSTPRGAQTLERAVALATQHGSTALLARCRPAAPVDPRVLRRSPAG
jgi:hypothetical protein